MSFLKKHGSFLYTNHGSLSTQEVCAVFIFMHEEM